VIRIWDTVTLRRVAVLRGHSGSVRSVAVSPDGLLVASASVDGTVKLWSSAMGVEVGSFRAGGPGGVAVSRVAFSGDGQSVVSGGSDGRVAVWMTNCCRKTKLVVSQRTVKASNFRSHGNFGPLFQNGLLSSKCIPQKN
jgi:WD40 repeat protein